MKNLLPVLLLLLLSTFVSAEELKFITVLSSPVGSFNKLEAVDPATAVRGATVNFCTGLGNGGTVELKGTKDASMGNINLMANTELGRTSDGDYVLTDITLNNGGSVEGGRLLSNVINVLGEAAGKSDNFLYSNKLTVAGAKTTGLNVNNKSIMQGTGSADEMVWSNEYQSDTSCGANCNQQYLLKQKGLAAPSACENRPSTPLQSAPCDSGTGTKTRQWLESICDWSAWNTSGCQTGVACCRIEKQTATFMWSNNTLDNYCNSWKTEETNTTIKFYGSTAISEWSRASNSSNYCVDAVKEGVILAGSNKGKYCYRHSYWQNASGCLNPKATSERYICKDIPWSAGEPKKCSPSEISYISGF